MTDELALGCGREGEDIAEEARGDLRRTTRRLARRHAATLVATLVGIIGLLTYALLQAVPVTGSAGVTRGAVLGMTLALLLSAAAVGAAVAVRFVSAPVIRRLEGQIRGLATVEEQSRAALERRAREADTLLEIARGTGATLDETQLFQLITQEAARACRVDRCTLYLVDESQTWVTPAMSQFADGTPDDATWEAFKTLGKLSPQAVPFLHEVVSRREPVALVDPARDPRIPIYWVDAFQIKSLFAVPVIHRGRVTGILAFEDVQEARPIDSEQINLAVALAEQTALAMQNARLHADTETRRRQAEVEAELVAAINASLDLDTILERIAAGSKELCGSELAAIALREPGSEAMRLRCHVPDPSLSDTDATGLGGAAQAEDEILVTGPAARSNPLSEAMQVNGEYGGVMRKEGVVAVMVVPIRSEHGVEGLLYVGNHSPRPFNSRDKAILRRLADHAAIAITNGQLYEQSQARLAQMSRLADLGRLINSSLDYRQVLDFVTGAALELLSGDMVRLWVAEHETGMLRLAALRERDADPERPLPAAALPIGQGLVGWVVEHKSARRSVAVLDDPLAVAADCAPADGYASKIAVPLLVGERALGALSLLTKSPRRFGPEEEELLQLFASQAAAALENARLYQRAQRAYDELARTQEQLTQAQKMEAVGQLAGGVAHDFNNLLTVIRGRSELLLERLQPDTPATRHVELILKTAERAAGLTRRLLAFSRKQILQPQVLQLNAVVVEMDRMLRRLIGEDIELSTALDPGVGHVWADAGQIEQVIMNLAVNARDAMPNGGKITIETANRDLDELGAREHVGLRPGRHVVLTIRDTGVGMDEETRRRIFEPFFTTKEPGKGTGLGLAMVYGVVQQSDGQIEVESATGRGTTFKIWLPRVADTAESRVPGAALARPAAGTEAILLLEDEPDVRVLAREILEAHGYTVLDAPKVEEALSLGEQYQGEIHLLLTDVVMPGMSGPHVASALASVRPEMKILYMSGYTDDAIGRHGVLEPGVAFLQKPFTSETLVSKVRAVLDAPGATT